MLFRKFFNDVNQNGTFEVSDSQKQNPIILNEDCGYIVGNQNVDEVIEGADCNTFNVNIQNGIGAVYPIP